MNYSTNKNNYNIVKRDRLAPQCDIHFIFLCDTLLWHLLFFIYMLFPPVVLSFSRYPRFSISDVFSPFSLFFFFFFWMAPHISYFALNRRDTNTIVMHDPQASRTTRDASRSCQCSDYHAILLQSCHADVTLTIRLSCRVDSPLFYHAKTQEELT